VLATRESVSPEDLEDFEVGDYIRKKYSLDG
jgi:hypothetical protein